MFRAVMEANTPRKWHLSTGDGIALASVIITVALAWQHSESAKQAAESQKRQNYVQIAVGVLSKGAPKDKDGKQEAFPDDEQALRKWSVDVLNKNTPETPIPETAQKALIEGKSTTSRWGGFEDSGSIYGNFYTGYDDWENTPKGTSASPTKPPPPSASGSGER